VINIRNEETYAKIFAISEERRRQEEENGEEL
jgi:hypothetical protein